MEHTEQPATKGFPWIATIVIVVAVLAGIQWWQTRPEAETADRSDSYSTSTEIVLGDLKPQGSSEQTQQPTASTNNQNKNLMHTVTIETNKGTIVFETYDADAPKTAANFITLAQKGFYDNLIFHRVIEGFMIQGGDPTGTGMGGPGYKFEDELDPTTQSYKTGYVRGTVAMANSGPNTNGSQFFIMHKDTPLPHKYTIFGKVVKGIEVVDAIATVAKNGNDKPLSDIVMKKVTVVAK